VRMLSPDRESAPGRGYFVPIHSYSVRVPPAGRKRPQ